MGGIAWFWTAYIACGALCVLAAFLGSRRRRLRPVDLTACAAAVECAKCGYDVRGLPGQICPECGSDLNGVGRVTPQFRRWQKFPPLVRALVWTACVALIGTVMAWQSIVNGLPMRLGIWSTDELWTPQGVLPESDRRLYQIEHRVDYYGPLITENGLMWMEETRAGGSLIPTREKVVIRVRRMQPGSLQQDGGDAGASMELDLISGAWALRHAGQVIESGNGVPPPETVLRLVELGRDDEAPGDTPGGMASETAMQPVDGARRDRFEAGMLYLRYVNQLMHEHGGLLTTEAYERLPPQWREDRPLAAFQPRHITQAAGGEPLVAGQSFGGMSARPDWGWFVPAAAHWVLVWAVGLWFVTRRRALKARHDSPPIG